MKFIIETLKELANIFAKFLAPLAFFAIIILFIRGMGPELCFGKTCLCHSRGSGSSKTTTCFNLVVFKGDSVVDTLQVWKHNIRPIIPTD